MERHSMDDSDDDGMVQFLSQQLVDDDEEEDDIQYTSVWHCPKINKFVTEDSKQVWSCNWCPDELDGSQPKPFYGWNKNKATTHLTGLGNQSIC